MTKNNYFQGYKSSRWAYLRDSEWELQNNPGGPCWWKDPHPEPGGQEMYRESAAADLQEQRDEEE